MPDHPLTEQERTILASIIRLQRRDLPPDAVTPQIVAKQHQAAFSWEVAGLGMNVFRLARRRSPKGDRWQRIVRKDHASPVAMERHKRVIGIAERLACWGHVELCQFDGRGGWHRELEAVVNRHGFTAETYPCDWGFLLRATGRDLRASQLPMATAPTKKDLFTEKDLIAYYGVPEQLVGALHLRLFRFRKKHETANHTPTFGWKIASSSNRKGPKYVYEKGAVAPIIKELMGIPN